MHRSRSQSGRGTNLESGDARRLYLILPKRNKVELCCDERLLDVNGLYRKDDEQLDKLTDTQIMQQHMKEFNRLLAKGLYERQEKRSATSYLWRCDPTA